MHRKGLSLFVVWVLLWTMVAPAYANGTPEGSSVPAADSSPSLQHRAASQGNNGITAVPIDDGGGSVTLPSSYGSAHASSQYYEYIDYVALTYDHTRNKASLEVKVVITTGDPYDYGDGQYVNAWIDWNRNGRFDTDEQVMQQMQYEDTVNYKGTLTFRSEFDARFENLQIFFDESLGGQDGALTFSPIMGQTARIRFTLKPGSLLTWLRVNHGYGYSPGPTGSWTWGSVAERQEYMAQQGNGTTTSIRFRIRDAKNKQVGEASFNDVVVGQEYGPVNLWTGRSTWDGIPFQNGLYRVEYSSPSWQLDYPKGSFVIHLYDDPSEVTRVTTATNDYRLNRIDVDHSYEEVPDDYRAGSMQWLKESVMINGGPRSGTSINVLGIVSDVGGGFFLGDLATLLLGETPVVGLLAAVGNSIVQQVVGGVIQDPLQDPEYEASSWVRPAGQCKTFGVYIDDPGYMADPVLAGTLAAYTRWMYVTTDYNTGNVPKYGYPDETHIVFDPFPYRIVSLDEDLSTDPPPGRNPYGVSTPPATVWVNDANPGDSPLFDQEHAFHDVTVVELGDAAAVQDRALYWYKKDMGIRPGWSMGLRSRPDFCAMPTGTPPSSPWYGEMPLSTSPISVQEAGTFQATPVDSDGNGLYDRLDIAIPVTVTQPDNYQAYASLSNQAGNRLIAQASRTVAMAAGEQTLIMSFWGPDIHNAQVDGPYQLAAMRLFGPEELVLENGQLTGALTAASFEAPGIQISGTATETAVPGTAGIAALTFDVPVQVSEERDYHLAATLFGSTGSIISEQFTTAHLLPGTHTMAVSFPGDEVNKSGQAGPYYVALEAVDSTAPKSSLTSHMTAPYAAADFQPPAARLTSITGQTDVDADRDGYADSLSVSVGVTVSEPGTYELRGTLLDSSGNAVAGATVTRAVSSPESNSWALSFSGSDIAAAGQSDLRLQASLSRIIDADNAQALAEPSPVPLLSPVNLALYVRPVFASFTGSFTDAGVDTDGNGRYNLLRIATGLTVNVAGNYRITGRLADANGAEMQQIMDTLTLATGAQTVNLDFSGLKIGNRRVDGPYHLTDVVLYYTGNGAQSWPLAAHHTDTFATAAYTYGQFERDGAMLTGNGTDQGVDIDSDGLFDLLQVDLEVDVQTEGYYRLDANLYTAADQYMDRAVSDTVWLPQGLSTIRLEYSGGKIRGFGNAAPYRIGDARLVKDQVVVDERTLAHVTGMYGPDQFDPLPADLTAVVSEMTVQLLQAEGQQVAIKALVRNQGGTPATNVLVRLNAGSSTFEWRAPEITGASPYLATGAWTPPAGTQTLTLSIDPADEVVEMDDSNNTVSVSLTFPLAFPGAPSNAAAALSGSSATVTWSPPPGDITTSRYHVYRSDTAAGPYAQLTAEPVQSMSYTDVTAGGHAYWYQVTSVDNNVPPMESLPSTAVSPPVPDSTPPVTTMVTKAGPEGTGQAMVVTLEASDDVSGVASTDYSLDSGSTWQAYTAPITLTDGTYPFAYRSTDMAGNVEPTHHETVTVDFKQPVISATADGTRDGIYFTGPVTVTLTATDQTAGVRDVTYQVDGGAPVTVVGATTSFTISTQGSHAVRYHATDNAGNVSAEGLLEIKYYTPPMLKVTYPSGGACSVGYKYVTLSWTAVVDVTAYELNNEQGGVGRVAYLGKDRSYTGCAQGSFWVVPLFADGSAGPSSNVVLVNSGPGTMSAEPVSGDAKLEESTEP